MILHLVIAFLSGVPALVYQVVWTREVALVVGSQVEAISIVLVAFFGGLALGSRALGGLADRFAAPLRLYGALEVGAGALAIASTALLGILGDIGLARFAETSLLVLCSAVLLPVTFLLGGTLPALLRSAVTAGPQTARVAGRLVAANTAGAVLGVGLAAVGAPAFGLRATLVAAGLMAIAVGSAALALGRARPPLAPTSHQAAAPAAPPRAILAAAALAGVATLAFEVLSARSAALRLGSSLYAWAAVLALFLMGLAVGNACLAQRASVSPRPATDLGLVEIGAALVLALGAARLAPPVYAPAAGLSLATLFVVAVSVLPPASLMGAAFPLFVRLALARGTALGVGFGAVSAWNTAGGIAGALAASFLLLPGLGLERGMLACAGLCGVLGIVFLARSPGPSASGLLRAGLAASLLGVAGWLSLGRPPAPGPARVIFVGHGRQATAVILRVAARRDLYVDGDPEASTGGNARETEEMLAALPLILHPAPRRLLEVGLGSGITLGAAARFPLEGIECVEIADSVLRAAPLFAPENRGVMEGADPRVRILRGDGRSHLARHPGAYDVVLANTVQPWSVGATGLYSQEYFARIAAALRPGGIAAQWLPAQRLGSEALAAILRSFFAVFPEGALYWGADNVIALGSLTPIAAHLPDALPGASSAAGELVHRLGLAAPGAIDARRLATAGQARDALGAGEVLHDDRPRLELWAARARVGEGSRELALLERIAQSGARGDPSADPLLLWIQSCAARLNGDAVQSQRLETAAAAAGFAPARRARIERMLTEAKAALAARNSTEAAQAFRAALADAPDDPTARFGLAALALERGDRVGARAELERLVAASPDYAEGWNLLGALAGQSGDRDRARAAFARALEADPTFPEAMTNAGLAAAAAGDFDVARAMLARLRALSPLNPPPEERALVAALTVKPDR